MNDSFFKLYACCLIVKGSKRSIVCDVQRNSFNFIPNGLYDILSEQTNQSIGAIKASYLDEYD
jgi:hypothetical protein